MGSAGVIIFALITTTLFVLILHESSRLKTLVFIPMGLSVIAVFCRLELFFDGAAGVINDVIVVAKRSYDIPYDYITVGGMNGEQFANSRTFVLFFLTVYIAIFVSMNVTLTHSMFSSLLAVLPVLILFAGLNVVPDELGLISCGVYVLASAAIRSEAANRQPLKILLYSIIVLLVGTVLFPKESFRHASVFERWNSNMQNTARQVVNQSGVNGNVMATGGMNQGQLGRVDSVVFRNENMMTVTTANLHKNQYFPVYVARDYTSNAWVVQDAWKDDEQEITESIVDFMENESEPKRFIGSDKETFYQDINKYEYSMSLKDGNGSGTKNAYDVNIGSFAPFADMLGAGASTMNYQNTVFNSYRAIRQRERQYREDVYQQYLDIPEEVSEIVTQLVGKPRLDTVAKREQYMNEVREYLIDNYTYTTSPGRTPMNIDFVAHFLVKSKKGYCTHFASAAVMMLRNAGIPARYVEGYALTAQQIEDGAVGNASVLRYVGESKKRLFEYEARTVTATDRSAHAWVEAYMDGYGWVTVEMTPATATAGVSARDYSGAITQYQQEENREDVLQTEEDESEEVFKDENELEAQTESEQQEEGASDEMQENGVIYKKTSIGLVLLACLFAVVLVGSLLLVQRKRQLDVRVQYLITHNKIVEFYAYLEQILAICGYGRAQEMQYETYGIWLKEHCEICNDKNMQELMNYIIAVRFGNKETVMRQYGEEMLHNTMIEMSDIYQWLFAQMGMKEKLTMIWKCRL